MDSPKFWAIAWCAIVSIILTVMLLLLIIIIMIIIISKFFHRETVRHLLKLYSHCAVSKIPALKSQLFIHFTSADLSWLGTKRSSRQRDEKGPVQMALKGTESRIRMSLWCQKKQMKHIHPPADRSLLTGMQPLCD